MNRKPTGTKRRRLKTQCRVENCALCAQDKKHRRRERSPLGPGAKVTLAHLVRAMQALGELPGAKVLKNGDILLNGGIQVNTLGAPAKDRLDKALFTLRKGKRR